MTEPSAPPSDLNLAAMYRVLAEAAPDAIITIDEASTILAVNPAAEGLFGYSAAELVGRSLHRLVPERLRAAHAAGMRRYLETGRRHIPWQGVRVPIQTSAGTELPVEISFGEFVTDGRRLFSGFLRDVSDRVASEKALRAANEQLQERMLELERSNLQLQDQACELEMHAEELQAMAAHLEEQTEAAEAARRHAEAAERRLQDAFAQAPAIVAVTEGPEHRYVLANRLAEEIAGRGPLVGRTFREAFPELQAQGFADLLDRVYQTGEPLVASEVPVELDRGPVRRETVHYSFVYQPLLGADGCVTGIMQHAIDVSAEVRAREVIAESERQLRTLIDAMPTLAWTARPDGYIDWYNARWYEYTGTTPEQMAGWGWQSVHDPAVLPQVLQRWQVSIATGEPFDMTFPLRGADGRFRAFLTRVTPLRDADQQVVRWFGTNTDIEAERAALQAAENANRVKVEFLATMSHELRTPLNAIAGYAELMELGIHGPVTEQQRGAIARIQRSQRHLLGLINDVLNFAKLEAGQVQYAIADVLVCEVVDGLEPLIAPQLQAKSLHFDRSACTEPCPVRADRDKLQQILLNLFSNAIQFTASAGTVSVRCAVAGEVVETIIEDTGIGIAPDRLEDVFAPFVQIHRRLNVPHEGTGLGLAISRDLARGMGGDLKVESAPGVGSTFTLTLPLGSSCATNAGA